MLVLRTEEQRAAMLEDELRAARAELESERASHRANLVEREADLEDKVRTTREEFQDQLEALEARHRDDLDAIERETAVRIAAIEASAAQDLEALRADLADRTDRFAGAEQEIANASAAAQQLGDELAEAQRALADARAGLEGREAEVAGMTDVIARLERQATDAEQRASKLASDLGDATQDNADLNRRLQELESRRALETAATEGRADLDDLLRITQERLAGQTEKLIAAEERSHDLQRELDQKLERIDEVESELRQHQMSEAMRQIRGEHEPAAADSPIPAGDAAPLEDRRATSPFVKELSLDAKKSLSRIQGLTQILKHKKDAKDQAQLIRQLTTYVRRLDHVVSDLTDAEELVRGTVELHPKRTDLEALVQRVVEESGIEETHTVHLDTERIVVALDQLRTEQILAGLLRGSGDRTASNKTIRVRLKSVEGGAMLSVEDPEPSSDASLSPVVQRFAEIQGGWAKVESDEEGGSSFRVFLPVTEADAANGNGDGTDLHILVEGQQEPWNKDAEQILVQELHRLSELSAED
jgi:signal transduction histidine kinase